MIGKSCDGTIANGVAATGVEGLRTIVPIGAISSWYDYYFAAGRPALRLRPRLALRLRREPRGPRHAAPPSSRSSSTRRPAPATGPGCGTSATT